MNAAQSALAEALRTSSVFPFQYDAPTDQVMLARLARNVLQDAAFLDQRVLPQSSGNATVAFADFERAASALPPRMPNLIFHQGHCGSTLISRLIAAASGSHALREPIVFRVFAAIYADAAFGDAQTDPAETIRRLSLFLRCFAQGEKSVTVKASSYCTGLAGPILSENPSVRALFLYLQPKVFIATMLGAEGNRSDLVSFAKIRRQRLRARRIEAPPLWAMSPGELASLAWLCEALAYAQAAKGDRATAIDFDAFLATPEDMLEAACRHFGLAADKDAVKAAVEGREMRAYAKAQEHQYSKDLRAEVLSASSREHKVEILRGLDWLHAAAAGSAEVRDAAGKLGVAL